MAFGWAYAFAPYTGYMIGFAKHIRLADASGLGGGLIVLYLQSVTEAASVNKTIHLTPDRRLHP